MHIRNAAAFLTRTKIVASLASCCTGRLEACINWLIAQWSLRGRCSPIWINGQVKNNPENLHLKLRCQKIMKLLLTISILQSTQKHILQKCLQALCFKYITASQYLTANRYILRVYEILFINTVQQFFLCGKTVNTEKSIRRKHCSVKLPIAKFRQRKLKSPIFALAESY